MEANHATLDVVRTKVASGDCVFNGPVKGGTLFFSTTVESIGEGIQSCTVGLPPSLSCTVDVANTHASTTLTHGPAANTFGEAEFSANQITANAGAGYIRSIWITSRAHFNEGPNASVATANLVLQR